MAEKQEIFLKRYIRSVKDFPQKGIIYRDITPLLQSPEGVRFALNAFVQNLPDLQIDKVVGIESRGFFFAALLADRLHAGIVPVRKKGKLPGETLKIGYDLEYGKDELEIHKDSIKPGEKILIHDDVLATGGTALAACRLVEKLQGSIVQCNFIMTLEALNGREVLKSYPVSSLLRY